MVKIYKLVRKFKIPSFYNNFLLQATPQIKLFRALMAKLPLREYFSGVLFRQPAAEFW